MKQTQGSFKSALCNFPSKKYSAIQNYLRKIHSIKNDTQISQPLKKQHHYSHSNFIMQSSNKDTTYLNQNFAEKAKKKIYEKKRCLSMKSQISPQFSKGNNRSKPSTIYNRGFNMTSMNIAVNSAEKRTENINKNYTYFKYSNKKKFNGTFDLNLKQRLKTQPESTFYADSQMKCQHKYIFSQHSLSQQADLQKSSNKIEIAKDNILSKIKTYVQQLDQKGENQLNEMLTNEYRKRIRFHNDAYRYEEKIKQMIITNQQIVNMLREELLIQRNIFNSHSEKAMNRINKPQISPSPDKQIIIDQLQMSYEERNFPQKIQTRQIFKQFNNSSMQQSLKQKQNTKEVESQLFQKEGAQNCNYQMQIQHVTKEFVSQWRKSQTHKKTMYQKFRKTIFQKFPEFKERQRKLKGQLGKRTKKSESSDDDNDSLFGQQIQAKIQKQAIHNQLIPIRHPQEAQNRIPSRILKQSPIKKMNTEISLSNSHTRQRGHSFEKTVILSKKNSISKGSTGTLDLLASQNKQEVAKINFSNLIDFIFKRAYFYSVSKKKVIQNKVPYGEMRYTPRVQKKDSNISFILYNGSSDQKRYLKVDKLNDKKLRATGNFLIKNKFKIMGLEKQGNQSFEFLRKCLDDAIQDYLKGTKSK